jgi:hypothetical protein
MEFVSQLAGLKFTDTPRCTDPLLAALAQLVNDAISDVARPQLLGFAPGSPLGPEPGPIRLRPSSFPCWSQCSGNILREGTSAAIRDGRDDVPLHLAMAGVLTSSTA